MIRGGRHVGDRSFFPANAEGAAPGEVIAAFLEQHYLEQPLPGLIVVGARSSWTSRSAGRHAVARRAARLARHGAQERAARHRAARARPRHAGRRGCSRCARRSACPRARSASSASTSATPWARRRSPPAWSTTGSRCRTPSTAASTSATSTPGDDYARHAPGAGAPLRARHRRGGQDPGPDPDRRRQGAGQRRARGRWPTSGLHQVVRGRRGQGARSASPALEELIIEAEARTPAARRRRIPACT